MICFFCKGPAHPSTGHRYSDTCMCCERCYREFLPWFKGRLHNPITQACAGDYTETNKRLARKRKDAR